MQEEQISTGVAANTTAGSEARPGRGWARALQNSTVPVVMLCFVLVWALVLLLTGGNLLDTGNAYNSYARQSQAWLDGRLDLGQDYPWLELAIVDGKYYVSFPPFPSVVLLPLVAIFGTAVPDVLLAFCIALLSVFHTVRLAEILLKSRKKAAFWSLFLLLGNGYLFLCLNGWVWFIAQNLCFMLSVAALHHAIRGRGGWSLACWAMAVGCRPMAALWLPLLLWLLWQDVRLRDPETGLWKAVLRRWYWAIAPCVLAAFYMTLNTLRFGNPLEFGHNYLPEFAQYGQQFSLSYMIPNLLEYLRLPVISEEGMLSFYTIGGDCAWLLNPIFWSGLAALCCGIFRRRGGATLWLLPVLSVIYLAIILMHRTLGGWQFGNRYLVDLMPWVFFGILCQQPDSDRFTEWMTPLAAVGCVLQILGTVAAYNHWI